MERSQQLIALAVIIVVTVVGLGLFIWLAPSATTQSQTATTTTIPEDKLVNATSQMTGTTTAKVTIVEWGDFECPFCGEEEPVIKQLISTYGSNPNFNFVFRNFPLPQHPNAKPAAEAALAAGAQGKYWQMYYALYEHQNDWVNEADPRVKFDVYAKMIGLDQTKFDAALNNHTYLAAVNADGADALALGLDHTPTLLLNGVEQTDVTFAALSAKIKAGL